MSDNDVIKQLRRENEELLLRLEEAEATLDAIRGGEVDAVVVGGANGQLVYTLEGTEQYYRVLIEKMQQGAATLSGDGTVLYCNQAFADLLHLSQEKVAGTFFDRMVLPADLPLWRSVLQKASAESNGKEIRLAPFDQPAFPVYVALNPLPVRGAVAVGMVLTDLTLQKRQIESDRRLAQEEAARIAAQESAQLAKRSEFALRESEERFRTLAVSTPMVVWTNLPDGTIDYINQRWFDMTGQTPEQVYQTPPAWTEAVHPEDRPQAKEIYRRAVAAGEPFEMTVRFRRADGAYLWHLNRAVPLKKDDGTVVKFIGTCTDIDHLKRSEDQVRFQARLLDAVGQAAVAVDPEGTVRYWNHFAESLHGWTQAEALGRDVLELVVPPEEIASAREIFARVRAGQSWFGEVLAQRRDRTTFPAFVSYTPLFDERNQFRAVIGISSDISEQKRIEQTLRFLADASATLAAVVDWQSTLQKVASLAVPFFADWCSVDMAEPDGSLRRLAVAHVDPTKIQLAHELERRYPLDLQSSRGALHVVRTGKSDMMGEIPDDLLVEGACDAEHLRILRELGLKSYMSVPLKARGKTLGVISFVSAESGRRYTASDLAFAEELARRAAVSLENAQLYAELRETDRLKDEFLAMLAHELRNPLAPIRNSLYIMKQPETTRANLQDAREMAERQVKHMARLLDDLLDVSRISRGKIELHDEIVDLKILVNRTVEAIRPFIKERGHQLTVFLPATSLRVKGDQTRLEQVLTNLLNNSAKYTDPGGHIELKLCREDRHAVLRIRDDGIGIAPEMLPKIFDLFVQAERRMDRSQGGVGIGLTLVRRLVELHRGSVEARSPGIGHGSEFVVRLPANDELVATDSPPSAPDDGHAPLPHHRILVVDDNQDAANSLAMLLRLAGQEVKTAYNGPTALALAMEFCPDLMLLDIGMPGMDGYQVARRLRATPVLEEVVLIALTGWGQEEDRRRSREAGFDHHLVKPVDPRALEQLLTMVR